MRVRQRREIEIEQGSKDQSFPLSPLRLDVANAQVWQGERLLKLTPKAFAVLRYLKEHPGQLVTKDELMQTVWAETVVTDGALATSMRELRKALKDDAQHPQYIETVHRRGYRFLTPRNSTPLGSGARGQGSEPSSPPAPVLVGRAADLTFLHQQFAKALTGERQILFVTGEPGIGKTTLVDVFLSEVRSPKSEPVPNPQPLTPKLGMAVGKGQCIEHYGAGEAYLPVLEALGRLCRGSEGTQLIALLNQHAPTWLVQMPTLLDAATLEVLQRKTQGATRERMLRELAEALEAITAERPLILVLEDLHWSDPSTLDLLSMIARRAEPARLLIIGTYRPVDAIVRNHPLQTVKHELQIQGLCQELALELLSEAAITEYLLGRFGLPSSFQGEGNSSVPWQRLAQLLHHRTEGNPLFLVAIVEDLITRGVIVQTAPNWEVQEEGVAEGRTPDSVRNLVTLQSLRLPSDTRQMLEAASVAGMEFSAATIAAALETETIAVERHCEHLAARQHFLRRIGVEEWPDGTLAARYSFLHAMYQQIWHERVSPTQLQHYHLRIGERKERAYGDRVREIAAELAIHFEQARDYRRAVQYLERSAHNALPRSAYPEALLLLRKGLHFLKRLPDTTERAQQELRLQMMMTNPLIALKGFTDPDIELACARSRVLCEQIDDTAQLFSVLGGLFLLHFTRGELHRAYELAKQLLHFAEKAQDPHLLVWAHFRLGEVLGLTDYLSARVHLEHSVALYHPSSALGFVQDPGVLSLSRLAWVLLILGYPDQALTKSHEALSLARKLSHPFSLIHAMEHATGVYRWRGEEQTAQDLDKELAVLSLEHGFSYWSTEGKLRHGVTLTRQGQIEDGLALIQQATQELQVRGEGLSLTFALFRLADVYGELGQPQEGLQVLTEAFAIAQRNGQIMWEATLYLRKGELTLQSQASRRQVKTGQDRSEDFHPQSLTLDPQAEAEECFRKAIEIAQQKQAKSFELRATMSLARLWQRQALEQRARSKGIKARNGKQESRNTQHVTRTKFVKTHKLLSEIYNWFTEGFDTKDLQEAKTLLDDLGEKEKRQSSRINQR